MSQFISDLLYFEIFTYGEYLESFAYLALAIALLLASRLFFDFTTRFKLADQLVNADNKAVAVSFSGYVLGVLLVIYGVMISPSRQEQFIYDLAATAIWGIFAIFLLALVRVINDKLIMSHFNNHSELVEDRNVGLGVVEAGSCVGSAFIISASLQGEIEQTIWLDFLSVGLYFGIGQVFFILFSKFYQLITRFNLHTEIENDNIAAGVSFGLSLAAFGYLIAGYIAVYDSLPGLLLWLVIALFIIAISRVAVDRLLLPSVALDREIAADRNWGVGLLEGVVTLVIAVIMVAEFL